MRSTAHLHTWQNNFMFLALTAFNRLHTWIWSWCWPNPHNEYVVMYYQEYVVQCLSKFCISLDACLLAIYCWWTGLANAKYVSIECAFSHMLLVRLTTFLMATKVSKYFVSKFEFRKIMYCTCLSVLFWFCRVTWYDEWVYNWLAYTNLMVSVRSDWWGPR